MDFREFAKEAYENAKAHGFYEDGSDAAEILAHAHSEWSEAFKEHQAGRPPVWRKCWACHNKPCDDAECSDFYDGMCLSDTIGEKPEGYAVELIDGAILLLGWTVSLGIELPDTDYEVPEEIIKLPMNLFIMLMHFFTSEIYEEFQESVRLYGTSDISDYVERAVACIFEWLRAKGLDPMKIMLEKHEYNKTRPYLHGRKKEE